MWNGLIEDWVKVKRGKEKVQSYLDKFDDIAWTSNSNSLSQSQCNNSLMLNNLDCTKYEIL